MRKRSSLDELLSAGLEATLREDNPWWRGERMGTLPPLRRWAFEPVMQGLKSGLAPVTVVRGPRQVGKTTLMNQAIQALLDEGVAPQRILRLQFDDLPLLKELIEPILELPRWYAQAILGKSLIRAASEGQKAFIFLDEVQNLPDWSPQLKHLVDINPVRALMTGSSSLRIEAGRDSLAGRVSTLEMGPLFLREIAELRGLGSCRPLLPANGLAPLKQKGLWQELRALGENLRAMRCAAFQAFSDRGAYPLAHAGPDHPWEQVADFLNETVIRRAIQHDLRVSPRGRRRDEHLLEEVFRFACRYAGQSPTLDLCRREIQRALSAGIGPRQARTYLKLLDDTLLIRLIEPLELRLKGRRGAPKICLCDHALRAAWLQEVVPLTPEGLRNSPHLADVAGHLAEGAVGYFFSSLLNLDVAHFPERGGEPEVDFVVTVGEQRIPIEIKYRRRIDHEDSVGLRSFMERPHYNAPFAILVTLTDDTGSDDPRIISLPLSSLLLMR